MKNLFKAVVIIGLMIMVAYSTDAQNLVPYVSNPIDPTNRTLSNTKAIGSTEWMADVDDYGNANYQIPIYTPPGTKSIKPEISVRYSSANGSGLLGYGWNLLAESTISRSGSNLYFNGEKREVRLDNKDNFTLDGVELICLNPQQFTVPTPYVYQFAAKSDKLSKVLRHTNTTDDYFVVYTKDGLTKTYGNTGSSSNGLVWKLTRVEDKNGNYMNYNYSKTGNEILLTSIDYTGNTNAGLAPYNSIIFSYKDRTDVAHSFIAGQAFSKTKVLEKISVQCEGVTKKEYVFAYTFDNYMSYSKLYSVKESDGAGNAYNETLLDWGELSSVTPPDGDLGAFANLEAVSGDINGDGINDLIGTSSTTNKFVFYLGSVTGSHTSVSSNFTNTAGNKIFLFDYDHNGEDEVVISEKQTGSFSVNNIKVYNYNSQSSSFNLLHSFQVNSGFDATGDQMFELAEALDITVADITGNGFSEILIYNSNFLYGIYDINGNSIPVPKNQQNSSNPNYVNTCLLYPDLDLLDFNGDGKTEFYLEDNDSGVFRLYEYDGATNSYQQRNISINHTLIGEFSGSDYIFADFNMDGKTDVLINSTSSLNIGVYFSNGNDFVLGEIDLVGNLLGANNINNLKVTDWNGDGRLDLLRLEPVPVNSPYHTTNPSSLAIIVYINKGVQKNSSGLYELILEKTGEACWINSTINDFSGDGTIDFAKNATVRFRPANSLLRLMGVYDGMNNFVKFDYESLARDSEYIKGNGASFPNIDFIGSKYVVKNKKTKDGIGGEKTTYYKYQEADINLFGLGMIGFKKRIVVGHNGLNAEYYYTPRFLSHSGNKFFAVEVSLVKGIRASDNYVFQDVYAGYEYTYLNSGQTMIQQVKQRLNYDYLKDVCTTIDNVYDASNGNLTSSTTKYYNWTLTNLEYTVEKNIAYTSLSSWHVAGLPQEVQTTTTKSGSPAYSRKVKYNYNTNGNISSIIYDQGSIQSVTETYSDYNAFGKAKRFDVAASDITTRTSFYTYDPKGRFITEEASVNGVVYTQQKDPMFGHVLSTTNIDGLTSGSTYDGFGRALTETTIDNNTKTYTYSWLNSLPNSRKAYYKADIIKSYGGSTTIEYDLLNRPVLTINRIGNGSGVEEIFSCTEYDAKGNPWKVSRPTTDLNVLKWTKSVYDDFGRILSVKYDNHMATTYQYNNREQIVSNQNANIYKKTVVDALGQTVSVEDNGGTISFVYNSQQKVVNKSTNGLDISYVYDNFGRLIEEFNPNNGLYMYNYNSLSELIYKNTPKGDEITYTYDNLGRISAEECNTTGELTEYEYYDMSASAGREMLKAVVSSNNTATAYNYDSFGRLSLRTESVEGNDYEFGYSYNNYSKLESKVFPTGYEVLYEYDQVSGKLLAVVDAQSGEYISRIEQFNHNVNMGAVSSALIGTGIRKNYFYNSDPTSSSYNELGEIAYSNTNSNEVLWNEKYHFNMESGNLLARIDPLRGRQESFSYDDLNRLTAVGVEGVWTQTNYADNGNISDDELIGEYIYDQTRLNAVQSIISSSSQINPGQQDIEYNYFNKTNLIVENTQAGNIQAEFLYGPDKQRRMMKHTDVNGKKSTYLYFGDFEIVKNGEEHAIHYIYGVTGLDAIYVNGETHKVEYLYPASDYQGSLRALVDMGNQQVAEYSYDAWGRRRNPEDWSYDINYLSSTPLYKMMNRGYTMHEHLDDFDLINMNGRMYDPVIRRMVSPDILDPDPYNTQAYNRFSYVLNNPLRYTDPTGHIPHSLMNQIAVQWNILNIVGEDDVRLEGYIGDAKAEMMAMIELSIEFAEVVKGSVGGGGIIPIIGFSFEKKGEEDNANPESAGNQVDRYDGYDASINIETYNCAGLAFRNYRNMGLDEVRSIIKSNAISGSGSVGDIKIWLWTYNVHLEYADGTMYSNEIRADFHVVGGRIRTAGQDPLDVYSKNGFRPVYGPGSGLSWQPLERSRALSNNRFARPGKENGQWIIKVRTYMMLETYIIPYKNY